MHTVIWISIGAEVIMQIVCYIAAAIACLTPVHVYGAIAARADGGESGPSCYKTIAVFGDSLSDDGNAYRLSGYKTPPSPPYNDGRFTNALVWNEYVADKLKQQLQNSAYGGAKVYESGLPCGPLPTLPGNGGANDTAQPAGGAPPAQGALAIGPPSVFYQLQVYLATHNPRKQKDILYIIWGGGNDILGSTGSSFNVTAFTEQYMASVKAAVEAGVENVLLMNTVIYPAPKTEEQATLLDEVNKEVEQQFTEYKAQVAADNKSVNLIFYDIAGFIASVPTKYADLFTNTEDPCLEGSTTPFSPITGVCPDPAKYLRWDYGHPTVTVHKLIADDFIRSALGIDSIAEYIKTCTE